MQLSELLARALNARRTEAEWEDVFRRWASPPSQTELDRCARAVREIRAAIDGYYKFASRNIRVFAQGSYHNRVNVRKESDVDVGVLCQDVFFELLPEGTTSADVGNVDSDYTYTRFKNEVGEALVAHFGSAAIRRGNKAFDIKATAQQVEADAAPFFVHRRYSSRDRYLSGVELRPDNGMPFRIINWPDQHYANGVAKHAATGDRFKKIVRIVKCLRNEMEDRHIIEAGSIPGFLIECLVYNVPNLLMEGTSYYSDVIASLECLSVYTMDDTTCKDWTEVSELKYLFNSLQKWTRQQANEFLVKALSHVKG